MAPARRTPLRRGFTLVELLTVIGIIILLLAILLPVVSQVRVRANVANTQQQMSRIMSACMNYYHEFNSYPGPLADSQIQGANFVAAANISNVQPAANQITSSENLVLGLLYYLKPPTGTGSANPQITFIPDNATGANQSKTNHDPVSLNYLHPATYHFIDYLPDELSAGPSGLMGNVDVTKKVAPAKDSSVPEFVDKIPDPMPILYLRAKPGASRIVTATRTPAGQQAQYDFSQLAPYGFTQVQANGTSGANTDAANPDQGFDPPVGTLPAGDTRTPLTTYFMNPNIAGQAKGKDGFILISAGPDRKYGTKDDIIVSP